MSAPEPKSYAYGSRLKHILRVEVDNAQADPTQLVVYFIDPKGNQLGPFTPTKVAQGVYRYDRTYTSSVPADTMGQWVTFWRGTGAAEGARPRTFNIYSSNIPGPTI